MTLHREPGPARRGQLSAAGLPWTTIRAEERTRYLGALEEAHVNENFEPFAMFVLDDVARSSHADGR